MNSVSENSKKILQIDKHRVKKVSNWECIVLIITYNKLIRRYNIYLYFKRG